MDRVEIPSLAPVEATTAVRVTAVATRWLLRVAAFLVPLTEAGLQLSILGVFCLGLPYTLGRCRQAAHDAPATRRPEMLVAVGLIGWLTLGLVAAMASGLTPRFSHVNKVLMAFAVLVGGLEVARQRDTELRRLFVLTLCGTAVAVAVGLMQYFFGTFPGEKLLLGDYEGWRGQLYLAGTGYRAVTGTLLNRLKMAEALLFSGAALTAAILTAHRKVVRWGGSVGLVGVTTGMYLTSVKAAMLSLGVGLVVVTLLSWRSWLHRVVPAGAVLLFVGGSLFVGYCVLTTLPLAHAPEGSFATRAWIWQHALTLFRERPWIGSGIGTYQVASGPIFNYEAGVWRTTAHNHHLTVLVEGGIIGFGLWMTACAGLVLGLRRCWSRSVEELTPGMVELRLFATCFLVAIAVQSFLHDVLWHPGTAVMVWLCVGVVLALGRQREPVAAGAA